VLATVCFDGNGYTEEWKREAADRGLDVEESVPEIFKAYLSPTSVEMLARTGVFTEKELLARNDVKWETYCKKIQIESRVMARMSINHIVPAALEYKTRLLNELALNRQVFGNLDGCRAETDLLANISRCVEDIRVKVEAMQEARAKANAIADVYGRAVAYHAIAESLRSLREPIDELEEIVDNSIWPLPKYRELLFIS